MNSTIDILILFYAKDEPSENRTKELLALFNKNSVEDFDATFHKLHEEIITIREKIDLFKTKTIKEQVSSCLSYIRQLKKDKNRIEVVQSLIHKTIYKDWSGNQQAHFDTMTHRLLNWKDLFFSYTRLSNYDVAGANNKNEKLIRLINPVFVCKGKPDWKEKNMLAEALCKEMKNMHSLDVFYDIWDIQPAKDTHETIKENCENSFCLVQLIQNGILSMNPNDNYSYKEYCLFYKKHSDLLKNAEDVLTNTIKDRFNYIITGKTIDDIKPAEDFHHDYTTWFDHITNTAYIKLHKDYKSEDVQKIIKDMSREIAGLKGRWISAVPD